MAFYRVDYTIVYSDGQRSSTGTNIRLDSPSESQFIDKMRQMYASAKNWTIIVNKFEKIAD